MQLVALYKTFDGDEWIDASLASIYEHVDGIVMVHSDISWLGERGNTVADGALAWCLVNDKSRKVSHVRGEYRTQEQQYAAGVELIRDKWRDPVVLAVDSDEVWDRESLERARQQIADRPNIPAFRCSMHTYLKTPFYQVRPTFGEPTCFFSKPELLLESPRGCRANAAMLDNVWMHHYTYVRRSRDLVERKIRQSCHADGGEEIVPNWMEDVYDKLPDGYNLHAFKRWQSVWGGIKRIPWSEVPQATRESAFMSHFWPDGLLMDGERNELFRLAHGRRQAIDLGTFKGLSAVILGLACERCHTVDSYDDVMYGCVDSEYVQLYREHEQSEAENRMLFERFGNITLEHCATADAAESWTNGTVDVLFVDADHSVGGTLENVRAWWPKLTAGARIIFHDDNDIHPGVQQAIDMMQKELSVRRLELAPHSGSLAAFEKVGI